MDQTALSRERLHEIEGNYGAEGGERPCGLFEIQRNGYGNRFMAQGGEALRDEIDLYEDVLLVPIRIFSHFPVEDGDFHEALRMRFSTERMIPAISSR